MKVGDLVALVGDIHRRGPYLVTGVTGKFAILGLDFPKNQVFKMSHLEVVDESW